ncbi:MAG: PSD1 and planctomycete cytochrome C domain-containing protein [Planctomycetota bacterium]|nr:PSD1 and planctomycete cytochrome C domain-containing protein [Planctomycetota bacterium]
MRQTGVISFVLAVVVACSTLVGQEPEKAVVVPSFESVIQPLFKAHCIKCHGPVSPKGGLNLSSVSTVLLGGKSGPAIRLSAAETSLLYEMVSSEKMPPEGDVLTAAQKGLIRVWINEGARTDLKDIVDDVDSVTPYDEVEYGYWSFSPPQYPAPPVVANRHRVSNPIDAFLLEKLEAQQLDFSPAASRSTLIRRVYLDLLGIPPSPAAVAYFTADESPAAYEQLVDRVLASPGYGERWGRHWLDIAGYSDSAGVLSADQDRQLIWRYRDYVIRALNQDQPYDQFIREQIAGDEISGYWDHFEQDDELPEHVVAAMDATGFLRTGPDSSRPDFNTIKNVNGLYYYPTIDNQLQILTSSLMGITVKCAKCHDHKFDPLTQKNYYQMQSVFMSVYNPDQWIPFRDRRRPLATRKQMAEADERNQQITTEVAGFKKEITEFRSQKADELYQMRLETVSEAIRSDVVAAITLKEDKRTDVEQYLVEKFEAFLRPPADKLEAVLAAEFDDYQNVVDEKNSAIAAKERGRINFDYIYAAYDVEGEPYTPLLRRGDAQTPGPLVTPGVPEMIQAEQPFQWTPAAKDAPTSGRRTAFANWLTQSRHPTTSRVMANRLWFHHFGEGLVSTVDDFGWAGENPQHQPLLDWLALELETHDWSLKHLHRQILTSTAYQQISQSRGELSRLAIQVDPQNRLLWRQNLRRLEAEPLRDSILHVAGALDNDMYGYPVAIKTRSDGEVVVNDGKMPQKRSIYLRNKRSAPVSMLQLFDQPDVETNCTRRAQSTVPLQALSLMNSDLVTNAATAFAEHALLVAPEDPVDYIFQSALSRTPTVAEREALSDFVSNQTELYLAKQGMQKVWAYGYGSVAETDSKLVSFTPFPHFENDQWQLGPGYPYKGSFWAGLNATAGHPGVDKPVILKWTSPINGTIKLTGMVEHPSPAGNGVRFTVTTDRQGQQGQWQVAHQRHDIKIPPFAVEANEVVYMVLDMNGELTSDNFNWTLEIQHIGEMREVVETWNSIAGFHGPLGDPSWVEDSARRRALVDLCHVLLSSNEFAYVD